MATQQDFEAFLSNLSDSDKFPLSSEPRQEIGYIEQTMPTFIPPKLAVSVGGEGSGPVQAIIISAPGAVGKSTLGRAIASRKNALFWDLSKSGIVGDRTLDGMLFNLAGDRTSEYLEYLSHGLQLLVIDALDEGYAKTGNENAFWNFLGNIAQRAKFSDGVCFVLLGRKQISDDAWFVLSQEGVKTSIYSIEPFDRAQANLYIENGVGEERLSEPILDCRDLIFEKLAFSVTGDLAGDSARDFLHYPPVLDVISELLKEETNPMALKNELLGQSIGAGDKPFAMLQDVIDRLLDREHGKYIGAIQNRVSETAGALEALDWDSLFGRQEQCHRLLCSSFGASLPDVPPQIPNAARAVYGRAVDDALLMHTFRQGESILANQVFEAFLHASALRGLFGGELEDLVREALTSVDRLPNRLLAEFYLEGADPQAENKIEATHLGIIYDSLLSGDSERCHLRLIIDGPEPSDLVEGSKIEGVFEFIMTEEHGPNVWVYPVNFVIDTSHGYEIAFLRILRNAFITYPGSVTIGDGKPDFRIGPAVELHVDTLKIGSQSLTVGGPTVLRPEEEEDDSVILQASTCATPVMTDRPNVYGNQGFFVKWPDSRRFPWWEYPLPDIEDDPDSNEYLTPVYHRFKAIARTFRSHGRGQLARTNQKIDDERVTRGPVGEALLRQLIEDGILVLDGQRYFWIPSRADTLLGVSWQHIRQGQIPDALKGYLVRFINSHGLLFETASSNYP